MRIERNNGNTDVHFYPSDYLGWIIAIAIGFLAAFAMLHH